MDEVAQNNGILFASQFGELGMPVKFIKYQKFFKTIIYYFDLEHTAQFSPKAIDRMLKIMSVHNHIDISYYPTHDTHFAISTTLVGSPTLYLTDLPLGAIGMEMGTGAFSFDWNDVKHVLVAGATGSGKSVFLNTLLYAILEQHKGNVMIDIIDCKRVGFQYWKKRKCCIYTEMNEIERDLKWACDEMERRYKTLSVMPNTKLTPLFIVVDELADLMLNKKYDCETYIIRLAQKARGANIHLVLATQRPTVNVVNGLIKANCDTRVCLKVASVRDSVVMLDHKGAEKLNGYGDCLIKLPNDFQEKRVQVAYHDWAQQ